MRMTDLVETAADRLAEAPMEEIGEVGSVLPRQMIQALLAGDPPLASGLVSVGDQLQPCGLDMTLGAIFQLTEAGRLGMDERHIPDRVPLPFDFWGWLHLGAGSYIVRLNEHLRLPLDVMALGRPRSSLARCGATLHSAVWDPGYEGKGESLLVVHNPAGLDLQKDTRILQLVFFRLAAATDAGYSGHYQGENLG